MQVLTPGMLNLQPGGRESSQRRVGLTSQSSRAKNENTSEILSSFYSKLN